jgi:hypothetical protein
VPFHLAGFVIPTLSNRSQHFPHSTGWKECPWRDINAGRAVKQALPAKAYATRGQPVVSHEENRSGGISSSQRVEKGEADGDLNPNFARLRMIKMG